MKRDVIAGKSAADAKTRLRGRAIVAGGKGAAARTMGPLGGIFSYTVSERYRPNNPCNDIVPLLCHSAIKFHLNLAACVLEISLVLLGSSPRQN